MYSVAFSMSFLPFLLVPMLSHDGVFSSSAHKLAVRSRATRETLLRGTLDAHRLPRSPGRQVPKLIFCEP